MTPRKAFPKFLNDRGVREIQVGVRELECVGVSPPHDHPHIYLNMGDEDAISCPYCGTTFRHDPGLATEQTEPPGCHYRP